MDAFPFFLGQPLVVCIEVPRGGRIKRSAAGRIEFVSPIRCPYNYGSVRDSVLAPDGDAYDALVLGPRVARTQIAEGRLLGVVDFVDKGVEDPKLIVGSAMSEYEHESVTRFFRRYARIKRILRFTRKTRFRGWRTF